MIETLRKAVRISSDAFDDELLGLEAAAKKDLEIAGVKNIDIEDPLIKRAVILYTKANFGWDNPDGQALQAMYLSLKQHLSLAGDYNAMD